MQDDPVLLILDDLHWADELTIGWIDFVAKSRPQDGGLFIIGTYRPEEAGIDLRALANRADIDRWEVNRLSEMETRRLIGDMLAHWAPQEALIQYLYSQTEGNPFFVGEFVRSAVEEKLLVRNEHGRWDLCRFDSPVSYAFDRELQMPKSLQDLVDRRLGRLCRDARHVVEVAAYGSEKWKGFS